MSRETLEIIHTASQLVTLPFAIVFTLWYSSRYEIDRKVAVKYAAVLVVMLYLFSHSFRWIGNLLHIPTEVNSAQTVMCLPIFTWILSKVWKIDTWRGADFAAPLTCLARGICLIGCNLIGCGQPVACDWGIYIPSEGCRVFPMALIDMLASFTMGAVALVYAKRLNYRGNGRVFAMAVGGLGVIRHLMQFWSTERYFGIIGFNDESIISVISVIMAAVIFQRNENRVNISKK